MNQEGNEQAEKEKEGREKEEGELSLLLIFMLQAGMTGCD